MIDVLHSSEVTLDLRPVDYEHYCPRVDTHTHLFLAYCLDTHTHTHVVLCQWTHTHHGWLESHGST